MNEPMATEHEATGARRSAGLASAFASEAAFRALYERALPRVYGYVYGRCGGDRSVAEDVTQETFVAAVREHRTFDGRADEVTWLIGIARHKLADHFRAREREERSRLRVVVGQAPVEGEIAAWRSADARASIVHALAVMPSMQRAAIVLHYADGLSIREIATQLGKSEKAIESLMTRGRETFRRAYGEALE